MDISALQDLTQEFKGVWAKAQARFYVQRAQSHCQQKYWSPALNMLMQLAKLGTEQNLNTQTWRTLVRTTLDVAARGGKRKAMAEVIEGYAWLAWSGQSHDTLPWSTQQCFATAEQFGHWDAGAALGDLLARQYPNYPHAPYASAHFRELQKISEGDLEPALMQANARRFGLAHQLALDTNQPKLAQHCLLRQGVALLLGGEAQNKGRKLLKSLQLDAFTPQEQLWYMIGMSRSDFWLDRVRAADVLDARATAVKASRPDAGPFTVEQMQRCVEYLFSRDGLDLQSAEEDRLEALIDLVFDGNKQQNMRHILSVRAKLQAQRDLPLAQSTHIADLLQADHTSELWRKSASSFKYLGRFALQTMSPQDVESIPRQAPDPFLLGAHATLEILHAKQKQDMGALIQALQHTLNSMREQPQWYRYPERLAPLASAWPGVLEWLASVDDEDELKDHALELVQDNVVQWTKYAPRPGYGWWLLAAHLQNANLDDAARCVAQRALNMQRQSPEEQTVRDEVMSKIIAQVIQQDDQITMLKWLEFAEMLYS